MDEIFHTHDHSTCCFKSSRYRSYHQTLDDIDFERGIWTAALEGDEGRVNQLLQRGVHVDALDNAGYTALIYAARAGHVHMCEILLEHGANVNSCTRSLSMTSLHRAASMGHYKVVDLLLRHGAAPNLTDKYGKTALHRAIQAMPNTIDADEIVKRLLPITDRTIKDMYGNTADDLYKNWKTTDRGRREMMEALFST